MEQILNDMKAQIKIAAFILLAVALLSFFSFRADKKLKVELTLQQWQVILNQLDQSSAPHTEVKLTASWITDQVRPQLDTTNKK
jgi:ABC-type metal ion transport system substrate-binding protein